MNTTSGKAIFSVASEVFLGKKLVQIIANKIEWTYPNVEKAINGDGKRSPHKELKSKHLDFEEKFITFNNNKRRAVNLVNKESSKKRCNLGRDVQEELSTLRSIKLADAMNIIANNVNNKEKRHVEENLQVIENIDDGKNENK